MPIIIMIILMGIIRRLLVKLYTFQVEFKRVCFRKKTLVSKDRAEENNFGIVSIIIDLRLRQDTLCLYFPDLHFLDFITVPLSDQRLGIWLTLRLQRGGRSRFFYLTFTSSSLVISTSFMIFANKLDSGTFCAIILLIGKPI